MSVVSSVIQHLSSLRFMLSCQLLAKPAPLLSKHALPEAGTTRALEVHVLRYFFGSRRAFNLLSLSS